LIDSSPVRVLVPCNGFGLGSLVVAGHPPRPGSARWCGSRWGWTVRPRTSIPQAGYRTVGVARVLLAAAPAVRRYLASAG
jgi:hypothetical protein